VDEAEYRRALRAIARRHHPDVGGDHQAFLAAVAALERRRAHARAARAAVEVQRGPWWRRAARRVRRRARAWRRERQEAQRRMRTPGRGSRQS
jgi:hypothetical protein